MFSLIFEPMKIELKKLLDKVNHIHFEEKPDALELKQEGTSFDTPIIADLTVFISGDKLVCQGKVKTQVNLECSRCLTVFSYPLETKLDFFLELKDGQLKVSSSDEEAEFSFPSTDEVEIDNLVREIILLALPLKPLCSEDCKGLCPVCGTDLNTSTCNCQKEKVGTRWEKLKDLLNE
jgi:uncharacterized protein